MPFKKKQAPETIPTELSSDDVSCRLTKYLILLRDDDNTPRHRRSFRGQANKAHENKAFDDSDIKETKPDTCLQPNVIQQYNNGVDNKKNGNTHLLKGGQDQFEEIDIKDEIDNQELDIELDKDQSDKLSNSLSETTGNVYEDWRISIDQFTSKRLGEKRKSSGLSRELRSYYKSQDNLITHYEGIRLDFDDSEETMAQFLNFRKKASQYAKITFFVNLLLLAIKIVAVVMSGSISLISSLVDSSVDLVSGVVIWVTSRAVKKTDRYVYPQGRTKLEPVSIVILSVIMSVASLQIIKESFTKIVNLSNGTSDPPLMDWTTFGIASATVVLKFLLYLLCRRIPHPTIQALAQDHRNDVVSNAAAILFGYIGSQQMQEKTAVSELVYLDPVGAVVISIYIIVMWCITGWDQIKMLIGHTATPEFLSRITWICMDHNKDIEKVDTVRAFHFGNHFLVEADIVLPPEMTLREAHDIGQPLQQKLERLPEVERAFVHIDYEYDHDPKTEHKVV